MSTELSQAELEKLVNGVPAKPNAEFYQQAVLDRQASVEAGRRIYEKVLFVRVKAPGVTDWVAYRAQQQDMIDYHESYQRYLNTKQGKQHARVDIIPNLDIAHLQELLDTGLTTIPKLAAADVPPHLEYAKRSAIKLNHVLEEQRNAEEESSSEEIRGSGSGIEMPTPDRPDNPIDLRRPAVPDRPGVAERDTAQRVQETRRDHSREVVNDWSYSFNVHMG